MADLHEVLAEIRGRMGVSQADLARDLNVAPATVSERERGIVIPPSAAMQSMAAKAGVGIVLTADGWEVIDRDALLRIKTGTPDRRAELHAKAVEAAETLDRISAQVKADGLPVRAPGEPGPAIPFYGPVPCGRPLLIEDPPEADLDFTAITAGVWDTHDGFVIQADGDSMEPHIRDGDWLVCRRQERWKNWDLVVVFIDGSSTVKQVQPHPDVERAGEQCLAPLNQRYGPYLDLDGAEVVMYGRVLGKLIYADLT